MRNIKRNLPLETRQRAVEPRLIAFPQRYAESLPTSWPGDPDLSSFWVGVHRLEELGLTFLGVEGEKTAAWCIFRRRS
jgi:hypothetical protein